MPDRRCHRGSDRVRATGRSEARGERDGRCLLRGREMTRYSLLVTLHVASVIVWLGAGTTLVLLAVYARRARVAFDQRQLAGLVEWMSLRVLAPASLAAAGFGVAAAHEGHW